MANDLAIKVPRDARGEPLERECVEVGSDVLALRAEVLGCCNVRVPHRRVLRVEDVHSDRIRRVPSNFNVDLAPMLELRVPVRKDGGYVIAIDAGVVRLDLGRPHARLVISKTEHVLSRAELAAAQILVSDMPDLGVGTRPGLKLFAHLDPHAPALEPEGVPDEADLALAQAAVGPGPDRVGVEVQRRVELLHEPQREVGPPRVVPGRRRVAVGQSESHGAQRAHAGQR
eukprot:CAMPEP_0198508000 /NCGR_PEP_ID=MMETSP1462-20131121/12676_1 /TAXON_ID=1333877 /ORGANISM="Brandtodinium nutriculum, Strain RCC3387" /LENGTH=228 /DNA_ID=CAMNT_0044237263 /DNA_START=674 /DNA_END=1356 /DNA_ORIENTATION=-